MHRLFCGSWKRCAVTCSATTFSAANRSATTLPTTGPSQVKSSHLEETSLLHSPTCRCGWHKLSRTWFFLVLVKEEALDAPSLARGSKRSLSGVSPPYAAPLSPKHLRAEAHPSEGTAFNPFSDLLIRLQIPGLGLFDLTICFPHKSSSRSDVSSSSAKRGLRCI